MKHQFSVTSIVKTKHTVEVELPVYSKHEMDSTIIYRKLFTRSEHGYTIQSISVDDNGEVSFDESTFIWPDLGVNGDYYLGIGEYASTKEEWVSALNNAKRTLSFWE